ncbi:hypothetical protein JCM3766R1_004258 [Sporobolomyces carnicolor]
MSLFSRRQIAVRRWGEPTQPFKQVAFLRQVKESLSEPYPQTSRIFANEADVKEAYCVNVLSPMLRIVEGFFSDFSKKHFEVVLFSEYVIKPKSGTSPIRLDHVLVLVTKHSGYSRQRKVEIQIPLIVIEAKRHDLVQAADWGLEGTAKQQMQHMNENVQKSLPQLLMYVFASIPPLRDLADTTVFSLPRIEDFSRAIQAAFCIIEPDPSEGPLARTVFNHGPRLALAFELYEALKELGLTKDSTRKLDDRLDAYVKKHSVPGSFDLPYRPKPRE